MSISATFQKALAFRPAPYIWYSLFASFGGFVYGFDTGSIGPITLLPAFHDTVGPLSATMHGLMVSMILIPAACVSIFSGSIADRLSRTTAISLGGFIYAVGALLNATAGIGTSQSAALVQMFVGRGVQGLGEGLFLSPITVYSIEISPRHMRGVMGGFVQLWIVVGIMCGYFVCYGMLNVSGTLSFRVPYIIQVFFASAIGLGSSTLLPKSPRWLLHNGRVAEVDAVCNRLGFSLSDKTDVFVGTPTPTPHASGFNTPFNASATSLPLPVAKPAMLSPFRKALSDMRACFAPAVRGRTLLAIYMQASQQLSGIDGVLYYAPVLFTQAGLSSSSASFLASGITGILNVVFTLGAQLVSNRVGRRPALIYGGALQALAMTVIAAIYGRPTTDKAGNYTVIAMIYLFSLSFVTTWAIHMRIHVTESQPVQTRALVSSLSLSANWLTNWVIAFTTPMFLEKVRWGPYAMWGGATWLAVGVFICVLPETRGGDMEATGPLRWELGRKKKVQGLEREIAVRFGGVDEKAPAVCEKTEVTAASIEL
ncbi:general substrate transporter [Geopyxis carbonaria]|nr:general substrate transporter [Geopyxis carbonaria]